MSLERRMQTHLTFYQDTHCQRKDVVKRVVKYVLKAVHAVIEDKINEETQLQKLSVRILNGDWEHHKKDPDIAPFYSEENELHAVDGLLF